MSQEAVSVRASQPRVVSSVEKKNGMFDISALVLIAILFAAGAVLKLTVGSLLASMGMRPNFIIAMYCLAIILVRPKIGQVLIVGLLAGALCQIPMLNATPLLNIPSELLGALVCGLLIKVPMNIAGKLDVNPLVSTSVATLVSGSVFAALSIYINVVSTGGDVLVAFAAYAAIVLGTAAFNAAIVQVLVVPLRKVLKK
ncbi:tryptophan transporter [Slackia piriformis]|uniref:tryptophan transporter n=1 Tax=Slackia piriformis TaxID=626934 RepID=UPI0023F502F2|nr:tryptophan transporter [Slackia piriformis]